MRLRLPLGELRLSRRREFLVRLEDREVESCRSSLFLLIPYGSDFPLSSCHFFSLFLSLFLFTSLSVCPPLSLTRARCFSFPILPRILSIPHGHTSPADFISRCGRRRRIGTTANALLWLSYLSNVNDARRVTSDRVGRQGYRVIQKIRSSEGITREQRLHAIKNRCEIATIIVSNFRIN